MSSKRNILLHVAVLLICCCLSSADDNRISKGKSLGDFWVLSKEYDFSKHKNLCTNEFGIQVTSNYLETVNFYTVKFYTPHLDILDVRFVVPNTGVLDPADGSIISAEVVLTVDGKQVAQSIQTRTTSSSGFTFTCGGGGGGSGELLLLEIPNSPPDGSPTPSARILGSQEMECPFFELVNMEDIILEGTLYDVDAGWHRLTIKAAMLDDNNPNDNDNSTLGPDGVLFLPNCGITPDNVPTDEMNFEFAAIVDPVVYLDLRGVISKKNKKREYEDNSYSEDENDD